MGDRVFEPGLQWNFNEFWHCAHPVFTFWNPFDNIYFVYKDDALHLSSLGSVLGITSFILHSEGWLVAFS